MLEGAGQVLYRCLVDPAYRTEDGQPWVLPVVRTIEAQMSADLTLNHEYLPLSGMKAFCDASTKLLLGESSQAIIQNRVRRRHLTKRLSIIIQLRELFKYIMLLADS